MLKRMIWFVLLALALDLTALPAYADEPLRISSMGVFVWPEYDQPGVLVQYQGEIAGKPDKTNPQEVSFLVPRGAGIGAACSIQPDGNHTSETWKESDADDGLTKVAFKISQPEFHVEYYFNPLTGSSDKRMDFSYTAALPADELHLDIQHPLKATNFILTPDTPNTHKDDDGFTYHTYTFKQVAQGQKLATNIAYTKTDPKPSVSGDKKPASASTTLSSEGGINPNQVIVILTAMGFVGIAGFFVWERRTRQAALEVTRFDPVERMPSGRSVSPGGYCTQCGSAMEVGDRFCAHCGSPVAKV